MCSGGNVLITSSASANTALHSTAARRPLVSPDADVTSLKTSCNITVPKSTTDASVCHLTSFTMDEFDDDFEPLPFCKSFQLSSVLVLCHTLFVVS